MNHCVISLTDADINDNKLAILLGTPLVLSLPGVVVQGQHRLCLVRCTYFIKERKVRAKATK
ncbi:hypothetical protein BDA96_03G099600 [Sorghum bicolor]|uniref:Uncharacterized protein n=2 Tax=Sorghum bicolor TaxID=4558 RepID=A0A921ULR5_SORBI|nr:hypothetical protein BDA96_03G099600 [Sorghum bicolor]OQU86470.1 hypothetical protein SORBI_3003G094850 [Sorghum bicolor]